MSPSLLNFFDAQNDQESMGKENIGPAPTLQATVTTNGRRFSDVTNTFSFFSSRRKTPESFHPSHFYDKVNPEHQEIAYLKNLLTQKEAILESTRQELQKSLYYSYKSSQQNKQLTQTNGQMFAELCMLREKYKLLEHDYKQMTSVFRIKRAELEETVRDLSQQLGNKHQIPTKDLGQSENPFQSAPWNLSTIHTQNCCGENPGKESNGVENHPQNNLLTKEAKTDGKRASTKGRLNGKQASHLTASCRQGGQAVSMPTLNQIDQSNASFSEQTIPEEVIADDICNEADSLSLANEEALKGERTCLRRQLTSVSYYDSPLHKKARKELEATSTPTLDQIDHPGAPLSRIGTRGDFCDDYIHKEGDRFPRANMSINEEASNEKRISLRRRSAHVSYKEPSLNAKLRRSGPTVSTQDLSRSDKRNTSDVLENLEKGRKGDSITDEPDRLSTLNVAANEENKNGKRVCSKQCPAVSTNGDSNVKANTNTKQEERTVQTLDKVCVDHIPQSEALHIDLSKIPKCPKTEDIASKATTVQQQPLQETSPCHTSASNTALEPTKIRSSTGRPMPKSVESSKEFPLNKVGEIKELHCNVPRKFGDLSRISEFPQNRDLPMEGNTSKTTRVQQHQAQESAPFHASTFNTALDATELKRSSTGRPVRKAAELRRSSYKEIPVNVKMRRSQ